MIQETGKYYLYRHIRPDKNEPFYIGIGTKFPTGNAYRRAYTKCKRKKIWNDIVNKNNGQYEIEIMLESDDYVFIKQKEVEFIAMYGRKDLGTGTLSNHTEGGEGCLGRLLSEESKQKMREKATGRRWTEITRLKIRNRVVRKGYTLSCETKEKMSLIKRQAHLAGTLVSNFKKGEEHSNSVLTEQQVLEILSLINEGVPNCVIAKQYNVKPNTIVYIYKGKTWKNVTNIKTAGVDRRQGLSIRSVLTTDKVKEIKLLLKEGFKGTDIAKKFNILPNLVSQIKHERVWKSIQI